MNDTTLPQRYALMDQGDTDLGAHPEGNYVRWDDYLTLRRLHNLSTTALNFANDALTVVERRRDVLKAECTRLRSTVPYAWMRPWVHVPDAEKIMHELSLGEDQPEGPGWIALYRGEAAEQPTAPPADKHGAAAFLRAKCASFNELATNTVRANRGQPTALSRDYERRARLALQWAEEWESRSKRK